MPVAPAGTVTERAPPFGQTSQPAIAVDIDRRAVHMAYIQFSLLHIPATVLVGDSLAMRFHEEWHTPAHVMGGWNAKLRRAEQKGEGGCTEAYARGIRT
ncbi:hypothetical protein [Rhizobium lusitanum]|uniref:hypothetical protein n=1 Tax=Rhizobium lusitanum TaxID=293958 RepID=UPI00195C8853|nr:hypothetical protein [Rhizobium lusitanum]MBM7045467.1 hypothetical protein [Rhizobium lusitanum]